MGKRFALSIIKILINTLFWYLNFYNPDYNIRVTNKLMDTKLSDISRFSTIETKTFPRPIS